MPQFEYEAIDDEGLPARGSVEAASFLDAAQRLEASGLTPRSIAEAREPVNPIEPPSIELVAAVQRLFSRRAEFSEPLGALAKEAPNRRHRRAVDGLNAGLQSDDAETLLGAVSRDPKPWAPLLAAATQSDEGVLVRLARESAETSTPGLGRWADTAYPVTVLLLMLLIVWPLAATVVPIFAQVFREFGLELPGVTVLVLAAAEALNGGGALLLAGVVLGVAAAYSTWPRWRGVVRASWVGRFVGASRLSVGAAAGRARVASDLLEADLKREDALRLAGLEAASRPAIDALAHAAFPEAKLAAVFETLSACNAEKSLRTAAPLATSTGVVVIALVGVLVGFSALALFAPLVRLVGALG